MGQQPQDIQVSKGKILYAPTWRGGWVSPSDQVDKIKVVLEALYQHYQDRYEIYFKPQYLTDISSLNQTGVTILDPSGDVNSVLLDIDVLITDYSSIAIDFLILDRPIILYVSDYDEYSEQRGLLFKLDELPMMVAKNESELLSSLDNPETPSAFASYQEFYDMTLERTSGDSATQAIEAMHSPAPISKYDDVELNHKTKVVIFAGSLKGNGITSSFINLVNAMDYNKFEFTLLIDHKLIGSRVSQLDIVNKIPSNVKIVFISFDKFRRSDRRRARRGAGLAIRGSLHRSNTLKLVKHTIGRHFRNHDFDVAIDFSGYNWRSNLFVSQLSARRKVVFQHNDIMKERALKQNVPDFILEGYNLFDKVVSVEPALMCINGEALSKYIRLDQLTYCRNMINPEAVIAKSNLDCLVADEVSNLRQMHPDAPIFVTAGRLSPEKNHMLLLDAFGLVLVEKPNAKLWILGDGPIAQQIIDYAKNLGISESCFFTGWIENPYPIIKKADCFVLSSAHEGQPMVLLEAMTLKVNVVACSLPGVNYIEKFGGIITKHTNVSLSQGMTDAISSDAPKITFDANAYKFEAMDDFYKNVIGL